MTGVLVGVIVALAGLSALMGGATVWLAKKALSLADEKTEAIEDMGELRLANEKFRTSVHGLDESLATKTEELEDEVAARKTAERQRDDALKSLVASGDPDDIARGINADLDRLSKMSETETADPTRPG